MLVTRAKRFVPPLRLGAAAACMALLGAAPLAAQASGGAAQDTSTQQMQKEIQEVGQKITQLRDKALQDSALQQEELVLQQEILKKMNDIDSATSARSDRMDRIKQSFQEATQKQDTAKIRSLMVEYDSLSQKMEETRQRAMQDQSIVADLDTFRIDLIQKMNTLDPHADSLIARLEALQSRLQGANDSTQKGQGSGQGGAGRRR